MFSEIHYDWQPTMSVKNINREPAIKSMYTRLVYKSILNLESNNKDVMEKIISSSIKNNTSLDIGGKLIWDQNTSSIIQILEGPVENVNKTINIIKRDTRHHDIYIIA